MSRCLQSLPARYRCEGSRDCAEDIDQRGCSSTSSETAAKTGDFGGIRRLPTDFHFLRAEAKNGSLLARMSIHILPENKGVLDSSVPIYFFKQLRTTSLQKVLMVRELPNQLAISFYATTVQYFRTGAMKHGFFMAHESSSWKFFARKSLVL
ncbi:hypothetical protein RvY_18655 [Ramazzottius varieornatus]|uniref:Uncharacterized protein n=1 Tax=Ramazzottius varieornatus TaxID=947166 RepID=A0A1D1W6K5_RAMVA|nr:hypothetical protein RvY_18655 [Ramazzottius varieornatus]